MKHADDIKRLVKETSFQASAETDGALRAQIARAGGTGDATQIAAKRKDNRRLIMKISAARIAIATAVCGAVVTAAVGVRIHRYYFLVRSYTIDKSVSDFPESPDLSTPEAAYATIMRDYMATGASLSEWAEISTWESEDKKRRTVSPERAQGCLKATINEVIVYKDRLAVVLAKMRVAGEVGYDQRTLFLHNGRWLNVGHDGLAPTAKKARARFLGKADRRYGSLMKSVGETPALRWNRPPIAAPESHLKPYVAFLQKQGREPHAFMMEALTEYPLVVMGEVHNRPTYWAFNAQLVRDSAFAQSVGTIYMELPSNGQGHIDRFLAQTTCQSELVIQMLRDFFELGWPCQPTLDFFVAVWEVNQALPADKKLRIRLVDMPRPWEKIQKKEDWRAYDVDRDLLMAQNVLHDRRTTYDRRNGFFIVGMGHAMEGLYCVDQTTPHPSAGWHLKQALGDQLFTVFQHAPAMTNHGAVRGRLALGLIDTALAQLDDRPMAFPLAQGPFGELPFDGMPDANVYGRFADGYDAYLYLIPLEDEILSPLIEGFYSEAFMPEIDRRYRLMHGRPLFPDVEALTPEKVIQMREASWGQPRSWVRNLGPKEAWQRGDDWQAQVLQERHLAVTREELIGELDKIYRGIKEIDPDTYTGRSWERHFGFDYLTSTRWDRMYQWWCDVIREHPLDSVAYGPLQRDPEGRPQIEVTTTLQGGITFSKVFVFRYLPLRRSWKSQFGLDLHLDPKWKDLPKRKEAPSS